MDLGALAPPLDHKLVLRDLEGPKGGLHQALVFKDAEAAGGVTPRQAGAVRQVGNGDPPGRAMATRPSPGAPVNPTQEGMSERLEAVLKTAVHNPGKDVEGLHRRTGGERGHAPHPELVAVDKQRPFSADPPSTTSLQMPRR